MAGIDWTAAETAIKAAVAASLTALVTGLQVHWADELADPRSVPPPNAILDLQLAPEDRSDEEASYDSGAALGQEVVVKTLQAWQATLVVQVHAAREGISGSYSARALAAQLLTDLQRPSVLETLRAAGLGFTDISGVIAKQYQPEDGWKPGTVASVRFYASTEATDREGYIEKARLVGTNPSETFIVDGTTLPPGS
jgi:hypothetical protein